MSLQLSRSGHAMPLKRLVVVNSILGRLKGVFRCFLKWLRLVAVFRVTQTVVGCFGHADYDEMSLDQW